MCIGMYVCMCRHAYLCTYIQAFVCLCVGGGWMGDGGGGGVVRALLGIDSEVVLTIFRMCIEICRWILK